MRSVLVIFCLLPLLVCGQSKKEALRESREVIENFVDGRFPVELSMTLNKQEGCNVFEYKVENGRLYINGSSGVALCRAFYDYVKSEEMGISSWSGNRMERPRSLFDKPAKRVVSPYQHHYYFNVVTYGYTMPYWDWSRWEQEIEWMALHGIDMPLALVANEAISARVWKKLGLTEEEIANYFVGPAHFPWMRMGNASGIDGPLPAGWHDDQVDLQHKILKKMRRLGMKPICPGFAGFVPQAMKRIFPDINIMETSWCGGAFHNWMLSPEEELFVRIGEMFIKEWEKEFGVNDYYLIDSFNEMEIPFPAHGTEERYSLLSKYGDNVYKSIKAGNPSATWVMQGWMFGYQRSIWDFKTLEALVSKVPDEKMLLLDLAVDYNYCFWHNGANWDHYKGYYNKPWVYSVIPNMGGKTGLTGNLEFYANGRLKALNSVNKGKLVGYGMAPEGIENNEVIYELVADAGWTTDSIDLQWWLKNYTNCRYGKMPKSMPEFWDGLQQSVYGTFTDHPRYNWQFRPGRVRKGSINAAESMFDGIEQLANSANGMRGNTLFEADFAEMTAHYLGGKMEILVQAIEEAYRAQKLADAEVLENKFMELGMGMDRVLSSHPTLRLDKWLDYAKAYGNKNKEEKAYYERNARRIVTIWGPPVDDYSARIWSGLIRDYYLPRWQHYFASKKTGEAFNMVNWERNWVENEQGLTTQEISEDVIGDCLALIDKAKDVTPGMIAMVDSHELGTWSVSGLTDNQSDLNWKLSAAQLKTIQGIALVSETGSCPLVESVVLNLDGTLVKGVEKSDEWDKKSRIYELKVPEHATGNNICELIIKVKRNGAENSAGKLMCIPTKN
ncbi:MAG: alpha-N-acetylglucosaminidase TIM-barrel domain-containing protein [Marinifilaceae bacterium]